jgi:hypothetical protein
MTMLLGVIPNGKVIEINDTRDLIVGDLVKVTFPPGSMGAMKFGSEETFTVAKKEANGKVFFKTSTGTILPMGVMGTKEALLSQLRLLTDVDDIVFMRTQSLGEPQNNEEEETPAEESVVPVDTEMMIPGLKIMRVVKNGALVADLGIGRSSRKEKLRRCSFRFLLLVELEQP